MLREKVSRLPTIRLMVTAKEYKKSGNMKIIFSTNFALKFCYQDFVTIRKFLSLAPMNGCFRLGDVWPQIAVCELCYN